MKRDGFLRKIPEMVVGTVIDFSAALPPDHLFVLAPEFAQKIVSLVNNEANAELDDMSLSVISETISQHVGIELTARITSYNVCYTKLLRCSTTRRKWI